MFRRTSAHILLACAALAAPASAARADELLDFLEARGLDAIATVQLERLAEAATGEEKAQLLDRLADTFARLLDSTDESGELARLLGRADDLAERLEKSPKADNLRVAAARARYRTAARVAESVRAGLPGDANAAAELLTQQVEILLEVSERAEKRANEIDRRIDPEKAMMAERRRAERDAQSGLAGVARYLAAWSLVYRGFLRDEPRDSARAASIFLPLLGARDQRLLPSEVSEPLRSDELFASAILGLALAKAPNAGFGEAERWMALLAYEDTHPSVREARLGWTMIAALEARSFAAAREYLAKIAPRDDAANWARVAASRAVEKGKGDPESAALLKEAIALLAARRELQAVRELVKRYSEDILGDADGDEGGEAGAGFLRAYVRGVQQFDDSQAAIARAGQDREKLESSSVRGPAADAAASLAEALKAEDAKQYPEAMRECQLMLAWSLRGAGRFADAAAAFDRCAADSVGDRAEQAARMSAISFDDARRETKDNAEKRRLADELVKRVDAFLARFPASDAVPELLVRKVSVVDEPVTADVDALLAVPPESKEWLASRKQALDALYRLFRGGKEAREPTGRKYAGVLAELPVDPSTGLPASSASIARQALEVLLSQEVRSVQAAVGLIAALEAAGKSGAFDLREAEEEIQYRRLQVAILADRWADVEALIAPFEKPEATKIWADAALRLAIRGAETRRRATAVGAPERDAFVATILRAGDAIFERSGGFADALDGVAGEAGPMAQVAGVLLDARLEAVRATSDARQAARGLELVEVLLKKRPNDGALLGAAATFAEAADENERAAEFLRALVGGLPPRTEPWFAAKVQQLRVLAKLSPERARTVLAQYRTLYPDLGPEPHRSRIKEIERALGGEQKGGAR